MDGNSRHQSFKVCASSSRTNHLRYKFTGNRCDFFGGDTPPNRQTPSQRCDGYLHLCAKRLGDRLHLYEVRDACFGVQAASGCWRAGCLPTLCSKAPHQEFPDFRPIYFSLPTTTERRALVSRWVLNVFIIGTPDSIPVS